jgi:hypothetical protein
MPADSHPAPQTMSEVEHDPTEARTFPMLLATLEEGVLSGDLSDAVKEIVAALSDSARDVGGKPSATLTLTLGFKLDGGLIEVRAEHKVKLPKGAPRSRSMFWATPNNNLTGRNPRQRDFNFRTIGTEVVEARRV